MPTKKVKIDKLTKTEFYDTYGVSVILMKDYLSSDREFLVEILQGVADKYLAITQYAVRAELRYFKRGTYNGPNNADDVLDENVEMLKAIGVTNWKLQRKTITFDNAIILFNKGSWEEGVYGGKAWGSIATAGYKLSTLMPVRFENMKEVIKAIDYLNDLEHNNNLYLAQYCTFHLGDALDNKMDAKPDEIIYRSSTAVRNIWRDLK